MQPVKFDYILELCTHEQKTNRPFERRYFHSLHEALINLLQIPPDRYGPSDDPQYGKQVSTVRILEQKEGKEHGVAFTFQMPLSDALDGDVSAGIYLGNEHLGNMDGMIGELEDKVDTRFSEFRSYDPGLPMIQLARCVYDDILSLVPDPAIEQFILDLQRKSPSSWAYQLEVWDFNQPIGGHLYYHTDFPAAFDQLISLPYFSPLPDGTPARLPKRYPEIKIYDDQGIQDVSIPLDFLQRLQGPSQTPLKVDMEIDGGLGRLEALAGVNLSDFDGYRRNGNRLTLGYINKDDNIFLPVPAFTQLQQGTGKLGPSRESPASAYTLQLEYRQVNWDILGSALTRTEFTSQTYPDLNAAVAAMHNLPVEDFDVAAAVKNEKDKVLHEATIYHTTGKYEVATMFRIVRPQEHVPSGVYVKVDAENLSTETLRAFKPFIQDLTYKGPLLYLVKADTGQQQTSDRRRQPGPRYFEGGGGRGIK